MFLTPDLFIMQVGVCPVLQKQPKERMQCRKTADMHTRRAGSKAMRPDGKLVNVEIHPQENEDHVDRNVFRPLSL